MVGVSKIPVVARSQSLPKMLKGLCTTQCQSQLFIWLISVWILAKKKLKKVQISGLNKLRELCTL